MPLGGTYRFISFWDPMVVKFSKSWRGGRIIFHWGDIFTLIKATLSNVLVYYMSIFKMPRKVQLALERCQRDFLWASGLENKDHLVNWEEVCKSKVYGAP